MALNYQSRRDHHTEPNTRKAREIAEGVLGKSLPLYAVIHHMNGDPANNNNSNLVICEDCSYHMLLHTRTDALLICGHADWRRCSYCGEYDSPDNLYINERNWLVFHRKCRNKYRQLSKLGIKLKG